MSHHDKTVTDVPDPTLHPKHPGRGNGTHLIEAEGDRPEIGGFYIFLNSGATLQVAWEQPQPIMPTLEAAKKYTATVIEQLQARGLTDDIDRTNWVSVAAAIQRIILDWNGKVQMRIGVEMAKRFGGDPTRLMH